MLIKTSKTLLSRSLHKSPWILRNLSGISMAFNKFPQDAKLGENKSLLIMHGLFGSKSNW